MRKNHVLLGMLLMGVSALAFADYGPYPNHPNLDDANNDLYSALNFLAQAKNAGDPASPFGGYRDDAEAVLQTQALPEINESVNYANAHPSAGACAVNNFNFSPNPYPNHPELSKAEVLLEEAVVSLQNACNGPNAFGGFRDQAIAAAQRAEGDIANAVKWANDHL